MWFPRWNSFILVFWHLYKAYLNVFTWIFLLTVFLPYVSFKPSYIWLKSFSNSILIHFQIQKIIESLSKIACSNLKIAVGDISKMLWVFFYMYGRWWWVCELWAQVRFWLLSIWIFSWGSAINCLLTFFHSELKYFRTDEE